MRSFLEFLHRNNMIILCCLVLRLLIHHVTSRKDTVSFWAPQFLTPINQLAFQVNYLSCSSFRCLSTLLSHIRHSSLGKTLLSTCRHRLKCSFLCISSQCLSYTLAKGLWLRDWCFKVLFNLYLIRRCLCRWLGDGRQNHRFTVFERGKGVYGGWGTLTIL